MNSRYHSGRSERVGGRRRIDESAGEVVIRHETLCRDAWITRNSCLVRITIAADRGPNHQFRRDPVLERQNTTHDLCNRKPNDQGIFQNEPACAGLTPNRQASSAISSTRMWRIMLAEQAAAVWRGSFTQ